MKHWSKFILGCLYDYGMNVLEMKISQLVSIVEKSPFSNYWEDDEVEITPVLKT